MAFKRPRANSPTSSQKRTRGNGQTGYVLLGTELPPDKDSDDGTFVPEWKQTVTDERGRRRLHGAFTGGFSAGYFNTVGSKEGWAPKAFVSSRSNRKTTDTAQRAEDFMDAEDLAEAAESRELETAQSFATIGRVGEQETDGFFGLFMTEEETMGVKIAHKMGWRRNQGVGRKIRRGVRLDDDEDSMSSAHMFAPSDSRVLSAAPQDINRKGLGFQSEARLGANEEKETKDRPMLALPFLDAPKKQPTKKIASKKSSFGVGVLNDTGSDDEDPYELGPKITFNKTLGKDKKAKKPSKFAKPGAGDKHVFVKKAAGKAAPRSTFDGKPPLRGFVLTIQSVDLTTKRKYPPPKIPPGWKSTKSNVPVSTGDDYTSVTDAAKASTLDAKGRASLLGETPLPGKSVFDFLSKEARDRLANLTGKKDLPQGLGQTAPEGYSSSEKKQPKDLWSFVPVLDKATAAAALSNGTTGWMPYSEDLKKRARYVAFLELRSGKKHELPERPTDMSISEWAKELEGFVQAAIAFRPATGLMASRFTSSTSSSHPGSGDVEKASETLLRKPEPKPEDPAEQAAKMGMYGAMTRQSFPFYPSRLLCKRFNVPPPPEVPHGSDYTSSEYGFKGKTEEPINRDAMNKIIHEAATRGNPMMQRPAWMNETEPPSGEVPPTKVPAAQVPRERVEQHAKVDVEKNEALSQERAAEDVFKSIFGDDDDDDDDDE
ncbi:G patch domain-containing protein 1 [Periconia macrospinosa]|uniref:G patch domain-containing protein 1 n=1 Tax=Periconia macrospinosa TaxID=97972 RepID=A0A2V1E743_9PLEO|nr:G patch domain-containing protein 1 [Periconia macrospinosa]